MAAAAPSRALGALGPASSRPLARTRSSPRRAARAVPRAATAVETPTAPADSVLGMTFTNWLLHEEKAGRVDADMAVLLSSVSVACKKIAAAVRSDYYKPGVDLPASANALFRDAMVGCGRTGVVASGADEDAKPFAVEESFAGDRVVVFDPLDGVTNVDAAVCTGSIFGVYAGKSECVPDWSSDDADAEIDQLCVANACNPGKNLEAAGYCMYSSSPSSCSPSATGSSGSRSIPL